MGLVRGVQVQFVPLNKANIPITSSFLRVYYLCTFQCV